MSGQYVRRQFMSSFKLLQKQGRGQAIVIVAFYIAQVLACVALGTWLLQGPITWGTGIAVGVLVFLIATRLRGFNNIIHECSHYTFSNTRDDNRVLGSVCAALILGSFRDYRDEHLTHHAHLGDYDKDMDLHGIQALHLEAPLTPKTVLRHIATPFLGLHFPYYLNPNFSSKDGLVYWILKMSLVGAAMVFLLVDPLAALIMVWLPHLWVFTALNYWTDCIDHGGLVEAGEELESSRNFIVPQPIRAILFPRNDCFHLVHHLFPQIPARHLESCHHKLLENPVYRERNEGYDDAPIMTPAE